MGAINFRYKNALPNSEHILKSLRTREHRQLCELLATARNEAGLTQRDLASRLKLPHSFVGKVEAGERRLDVIEFVAIARALRIDPVELFARFVRG